MGDSQLRIESVESGGESMVGEEGDSESSFWPDSIDLAEDLLSMSDSTEGINEFSEGERDKMDVFEKDPGFLAKFFAEPAMPMGEPNIEQKVDCVVRLDPLRI